ncbi:hypothetical protein HWV62_21090 [Athelia sp. TMB]|nr:hypothetical protein HWV62_21090 [Athelia sp. TMB]
MSISIIKIAVYRRNLLWQRLPLNKHLVAEFKARGVDLLNEDTEHELTDGAGDKIAPRIVVKLHPADVSHMAFMKTVDMDIARLGNARSIHGTPSAITVDERIDAVLQRIVPIVNDLAYIHPAMTLAWIVLSSTCEAVRNKIEEDGVVRDLAESLRKMAGATSELPNLPAIEGTAEVIEEIRSRAAKHSLSDMSSQIADYKWRCVDLAKKLSLSLQNCDHVADAPPVTEALPKGPTFNAIGTSGTVTMIAGHLINGDYSVVQGEDSGVQNRLKGIQDEQKKQIIDKWISAPDTSSNYKAAREKHQPGTGSWLVGGSVFKRWKKYPNSILWLRGGPGCGKTILCSSAIEDVKNFCKGKSSVAYAYFFFDGTSGQSTLAAHESLVRSIVMQLSDQFDGIPPALVDLYEDEREGRDQPLISALENTLLQILRSFDTAYIIVDALDECSEWSKVLKWIRSITILASGNLHLMVTSRPEPDIKYRLRPLSNLQELDVADQQESNDISRYVDVRLSEVNKWTEAQKSLVRNALLRGAGGVFRWVALQFDQLVSNCASLAEIEQHLQSLPRDLDEAYTEIIKRSPRPADLVLFLQCMIFGREEFTAEELAEVALINFGNSGVKLPFSDSTRRYGTSDVVLSTCYGLIVEAKGMLVVVIKIAHFSVKEFLLSKAIQLGTTNSIQINESLSHQAIAKTCLAYLLQFSELDSITTANIESFPLAFYAATWCVSHVRSIRGEDIDTILEQMILHLALPAVSCTLINWSRLRDDRQHSILQSPIGLCDVTPSLYSSITIAPRELVDHLISNGKCGITLHMASDRGSLAIAQLLLEKGADVNAKKGTRGTPLQAASFEGHVEIAQLLLEKGADIHAKSGRYGTALQAASCQGHLKTIEMLLEQGADVNASGGQYGTALQGASCCGHLEITDVLLGKGADVNATGGHYGTALQAASYQGHLEIAQLLLRNGAHVNDIGGEYGTALQAASYRGGLTIARLLLKVGADVNVMGGQFGTALQAALSQGHLKIARLLLERGADVNATGGHFGTALQAASYAGSVKMTQLLLEKGADANVKRGAYGTALNAARVVAPHWMSKSSIKVEEIEQLLKEHGAMETEPNI